MICDTPLPPMRYPPGLTPKHYRASWVIPRRVSRSTDMAMLQLKCKRERPKQLDTSSTNLSERRWISGKRKKRTAINKGLRFLAAHRIVTRDRARIALGRDQNGKFKYRQVSAKTEEECLTKLKAIKESLGLMQKLDPHMPFGAWMDYWFREFCAPRLRESTQETYSNRIYKQNL